MANMQQVEELDSLEAIYDGSDEITIERCAQQSEIGITCYHRSKPRTAFLRFRVKLPTGYLSEDTGCSVSPSFELESALVSVGRLSRFCQELDRLYGEQPDSPILFSWIEFLRIEAWELTEESNLMDPRALKLWVTPDSTEQEQAAEKEPEISTCVNCQEVVSCSILQTCGHKICSACLPATMQVEDANKTTNCCPLPSCRTVLAAEDIQSFATCHEPWMSITPKILGTSFQDIVVFCPKCEDRGMDSPVLLNPAQHTAATAPKTKASSCNCSCFSCGWRFCGLCRSPCHPGSGCFDVSSRVVRLAKRRPPLSSELQDMAVRLAEELKMEEAEEAKRLADALQNCDFNAIRNSFLETYHDRLLQSLASAFGPCAKLYRAPLSTAVMDRFMESYVQHPNTELRPAFHGTNVSNHDSIFQRGLLIPGDENELSVVHGAAHGRGVYTANIDAAWLSRGFCSHPTLLICGVLQTSTVRHVYDAMVVGDSSHVVPLYVFESESFESSLKPQVTVSAPALPSPVLHAPKHSPKPANAKGNVKMSPQTKEQKTTTKQSKFKARLAKQSNRR
mmetsp:Transcript_21075/g.39197  ORF Transcript_21075/g.39197 Transcript_21075/m.39197 type:complete len:564 (+) Transcript_21075:56-1747(+)